MADLALSDFGERYAFLDPAGSRRPRELKRVRARSAIVVVTSDSLERIFVLLAWAERTTTAALVDRVFAVHEELHPRIFACEANAMQALFADMLTLEARHRGARLPLVPVQQPTKVDKDWRIRSALQPVIAHGRLFTQEHQVELRREIREFPTGQMKDLIDALASAIALVPPRPPQRVRDSEKEQLASYLRASGCDPRHIEARLAEVHGR